jgi:hypothetical protein
MGSDFKTELETYFPALPACPPNCRYSSIQEVYEQFFEHMEGRSITEPWQEERVFLFAENFPYLVKLEFYNKKVGRWLEAKASRAIEYLKEKSLDEELHRLDHSRARTLFWILDIIVDPDAIHRNVSKSVRGDWIYARRYQREKSASPIKVATTTVRDSGHTVVVTSFWTDDAWMKKYAHPKPVYSRPRRK